MKKWLLLICLCVASCIKIERTSWYSMEGMYVFHVIPSTESNYVLSDEFIYNWEGLVGYNEPDSLFADIYRNGIYYTTKKCDTSLVNIRNNDVIDVVVSNLKLNGIEHISHETYKDKGFDFIEDYPFCKALDDVFIGTNNFDANIIEYDWADSVTFHHTPIATNVVPITKIYFVQIISDLQDIVCDSLLVSGISRSHDFKIAEDIVGNMWIPLKDKQIINNHAVYAARFLSFGLPDARQSDYSWNIIATLKCYLAFKANNRYVKIDITKKMLTLTSGGVITIYINEQDLKGDSYFETGVGDWNIIETEINL